MCIRDRSNSSTLSVTSTDASGNESEATTTRVVIGITFEGPAANQTGTNVMDAGDHGWISLNETLAAGERLVLDNAFLENLLNKMRESGDNSNTTGINCTIGLRGPNFTNTAEIHGHDTSGQFLGNHYIRIIALGVRTRQAGLVIHSNGVNGNNGSVNTTSGFASMCGFLEITSDGNNLRAGMGTNGSYGVVQGDESTKTYSDWNGYKRETGDQGYGITSEDVVMGFWTFNAGDFDGDLVDWTDITEVSVPAPAAPDAPTVSTASADTVTGTAEAGSTVTVTDSNGDEIGTATADSDGNYSVTLSPEQSNGSTLTVTATDASGNESEETTTTIVLGITLVGPSDNQTGTNLFDAGDHGWATLDESLSAGERLTLTNAFLSSLVDAMPDNSYIIIGLKSSTWSSTINDDDIFDNNYNGFKGRAYLKIEKYDSSNSGIIRMSLGANGTNSSSVDVGSGGSINSGYNAFIEISADGNNIRLGQGLLTANGGDDPATTPYCDWSDISSTNKAQTGDQDFGITSLDVVIGGGGNSSDSIKTHGGMNTAPVEWIIMSQIGVPSTPCTAPTSQATSAVFGTETTSTLNLESFTAPSGGAVGYAIYINNSNSFTAPLNGVEPTADLSWNGSGQQPVYFGTSASPNITVTDLDPGTTYYFQVYAYNNSSGTETYETTGLNASDDTTAPVIPGITLEGPNANQSGTNLSDVDDWGWASLNNPLGAGERVVFNNDFMLDIFSSMPDNYVVRIGLKDGSWDNSEGNGRDGFLGGTFFLIRRESVDSGSISFWVNGLPSQVFNPSAVTLSSSIPLTNKFSAFIELDAPGDKINIGLNSTDFSDELDVYSTAYCDWAENAKATTNNEI